MRELIERPPVYDACVARFAVSRGTIWTWGDAIYNPDGVVIPASLLDHEQVHSERQLAAGVERWWARYLDDADFRLAEELPAHRAEWRRIRATCARTERRHLLRQVAGRLSGPLYGSVVGFADAKRLIAHGFD